MVKGKVIKDETTLSLPSGFQPSCIVQLLPPTAITALALYSAWRLIAVGTAHGLALYDYKTNTKILYKCTLNASGKKHLKYRKTFGEKKKKISNARGIFVRSQIFLL